MENNKNVPEIRFKGFTNAWELLFVEDICCIGTGQSNTQDKQDSGIYPFYVRSPIIEKSNRYLYDEEAVLTVGDGVGTGKVFHYVNGKYDLHQRVYRMYGFKDGFSAKFFYFNFSNYFYDRVMAMTAKTSVDSVRYEMIAKMEMSIPSFEEQLKVSKLLSLINEDIVLHQRKLETLEKIKKSMLEKMFPKDGSDVPEIRFNGFTNAWEQYRIGDISEIIAGGDVDKQKLVENGVYPVIANALSDNGIIGYYNNEFRVHAPAITVTGRGDVGHAVARMVNFTPVVRLLTIIPTHLLDAIFVENSINRLKIINESTGVPQLTVPQLSRYEIKITCFDEQEKIGCLLNNLDQNIVLHQRKLEMLQNIKKSMLEKMFVS